MGRNNTSLGQSGFSSGYSPYIDSMMGYSTENPNRNTQAAPPSTSYSGGTSGIGTLDYENTQSGYNSSSLPSVSDPDKTMGDVSKQQYDSYITNFRDFENALVSARDDTSLIDAVPEDVARESQKAKDIAERNRGRYGYQQTAIERDESGRASQRGEALNLAGGLTNARLAQREQNMKMLGDLINIGQGVNRSSLSQLGTAGENAVMRKNSYQQAQAQSKSQRNGMIGSMGMALAAFMI
jgi:hypothetical protein